MSVILADQCRLCLETTALSLIFTDRDDNLSEKALYCLDIKIQKGDGIPMICKDCRTQLNNFYIFRQKCRSVDQKLHIKIEQKVRNVERKIKQDNIDDNLEHWKLQIKPDPDDGILLNQLEDIEDWVVKHDFEINTSDETKSVNKNIPYGIKTQSDNLKTDNCTFDSNSPTLQCESCGKIFTRKTSLKKHLETHTGVKRFSCKICNKQFTRAEHEVVHMRAHRGIRPFICHMCARGFTKRQDLLRHMRIHSDEKKYACPCCERRFKRSSDVNSHMRSHTGAKPYACTICTNKYSSHSSFKKHQRTHCSNDKSTLVT